jgi:hypothetical protein
MVYHSYSEVNLRSPSMIIKSHSVVERADTSKNLERIEPLYNAIMILIPSRTNCSFI